jgi:uncharacterized membrane protein YheB (UPF0754 family)
MQIHDDKSVTLDYNETLLATRVMYKIWLRNKNKIKRADQAMNWLNNNSNVNLLRKQSLLANWTTFKDRAIAEVQQYQKWYDLYDLLLKHKRLQK